MSDDMHCGGRAGAPRPPARATGGPAASGPITGCRAIDSHAHVFRRGLPPSPDARYVPAYDAVPEAHAAMLAAHGLCGGVLVQPSFLGTDNSYLLAALAADRPLRRGIAVVPPDCPQDEMRALAAQGIAGLRLNLVGRPDPDLAAPGWRDFLARAARCGFQVEVQAPAARLPRLLAGLLASDVPAVVVDHFGLPTRDLGAADPGFQGLMDLAAHEPRLFLKLSAPYRLDGGDPLPLAQAARAAFGAGRLMFGTDWPHTQHEAGADTADLLALLARVFPAAELRQVLLDTPARLFGFTLPQMAEPA
ncbi:amidohydrolase family protein [Azorhizobium doebereinerae]|uniref:amidohydrolase family protein n=1 Tax=Azorhizobium doebereinerae TaxID=281091 RepID=UPI000415E01F|nr:amidohydrolase family protein [Azorhizobium doebereinerae]